MGGTEILPVSDEWQLFAMGKCGLLIRNRQPVATEVFMRLAESCRSEFGAGCLSESIPAYDSLVLKFARPADMPSVVARVKRLVQSLGDATVVSGKLHEIAVDFSTGLDWDLAESESGLDRDAFVETLCGEEYSVAMLGFLPGFVYLDGLPGTLHLPRRASPRRAVGAGSVAIGGGQCGIYRLPSPGGWQILGQASFESHLSIEDLLESVRFGDRVRFVAG